MTGKGQDLEFAPQDARCATAGMWTLNGATGSSSKNVELATAALR